MKQPSDVDGNDVEQDKYTEVADKFVARHTCVGPPTAYPPGPLPRMPRWTPTPDGADAKRPHLESRLSTFIKAAILPLKLSQMPFADLLFKAEAGCEVFYFVGCDANPQAGVVPMRIILVQCKVKQRYAGGSFLTEFCIRPHIHTRRLPFGQHNKVGMLDHYTHWDVAALLLDSGRAALRDLKIVFSKMLHRNQLFHQDIVSGIDTSVEPHVVDFAEIVSGHGPGGGGGGGNVDGSAEVDWDTGVLPRAKKSSATRRLASDEQSLCMEPPSDH